MFRIGGRHRQLQPNHNVRQQEYVCVGVWLLKHTRKQGGRNEGRLTVESRALGFGNGEKESEKSNTPPHTTHHQPMPLYPIPSHPTPSHPTPPHPTPPHPTPHHTTPPHTTPPHTTPHDSTAQHSTAQHSTAQHSTAQHEVARHDATTQHETERPSSKIHPQTTATAYLDLNTTADWDGLSIAIPKDDRRSEQRLRPTCS